MSSRNKSMKRNNAMREGVSKKGENSQKKSPTFVPLNGLSQSAKDRQMNHKKVRPPKNLNLVEGDPVDIMKSQRKTRELKTFPNEQLLSSKIKEVNGMDFSNHSIEQYYRNCHSRSDSPEISEDSTNSSSITNSSMQSGSQEEACVSNANNSTDVKSSVRENDLPADSNYDINPQEYGSENLDYDSHFIDPDELDNTIRNCRYSKNAAIIGLLKQNIISLDALDLDNIHNVGYYSEDDIEYPFSNEEVEIIGEKSRTNNSVRQSESESRGIADYPFLVPHPDDPEFYTHPLQAYGEIDDAGIDFRLERLGEKTVITPRQFFIREALNDDKFTFQKATTTAPKPNSNINFPKINSARSSCDQNYRDVERNNSYDLINDENDGFTLNRDEFPTL